MRWTFDLGEVTDVATQRPETLARATGWTVPCDGARPAERFGLFERWLSGGCPLPSPKLPPQRHEELPFSPTNEVNFGVLDLS